MTSDPVTAHTTDTERFWDRGAKDYDAAHDRDDFVGNPLWIRMEVTLRLLAPGPGSVLDCGMGPGRLLVELERRGWSVAGVDLAGEMVALARSRLPGSADRLVQGSAESLPFSGESFDAVVATGVFEYVENLPRALSEVARVLRPDGRFIVSMPNTRAVGTIWRHGVVYTVTRAAKARFRPGSSTPLPRPGLVSRRRLEALLIEAGFGVEGIEYIVLSPRALRRLAPSLSVGVAGGLDRLREHAGPALGSHYVLAARRNDGAQG